MSGNKPKILIISDFYLPGYKSGALRTVVNMVERLSDEFDFWILTQNRDSDGDITRFAQVKLQEWQVVGNAQVFYAAPEWFNLKNIADSINQLKPQTIYLNSLFSTRTVKLLILRRLGKIGKIPIVLAPEGEFSAGALRLKSGKKRVFLKTAFALGLYRNLIWKAAAEEEKGDIEREVGENMEIFVAPNMPPRRILENFSPEMKPPKEKGKMRLVFLSRVSPKKNLKFALELLRKSGGKVEFDVYGSLEEENYWRECERAIDVLPKNISLNFRGAVAHEQVAETLAKYHFFILPTLGENFGHVVIEALATGCPVLLSDRTPWRNLDSAKAGWDLPLENIGEWQAALRKCLEMSAEEYCETSVAARDYAVKWLAAPEIENANRAVIRRAAQD